MVKSIFSDIKLFFQATFTSILLYGSTTLTLSKCIEKNLEGNYTRILWAILNKSWTHNIPRNNSRSATHCHLKKLPSMANTTWWTLLEKQGPIQKWHSSMAPYTWTCLCWPTSKNLFTSALCGHRRYFGRPTRSDWRERERERERVREIHPVSVIWWWWVWFYGISTIIGYLRTILFYTCISNFQTHFGR